jgi:cytochrome c oxidase subunit II
MSSFRIEEADRPHVIRLAILWVILSVIGIIAILLFLHIPPGDQSLQGQDQTNTLLLMTVLAAPVFIGVVMLIVYSAIYFRRTGPELADGPPMLGNTPVQVVWITVSTIMVLFLAFVGITTLATNSSAQTVPGQSSSLTSGSAGGAGSEMQVQVIAQQWYFTYRYADYGGVETTHLYLPIDRPVELHITSLDIIHSFWAYQLGVKADANQGVDNIFHVTPQKIGSFQVRCAELCGLWHGNMADSNGRVVSQSDFDTWIAQQQADFATIAKAVPSYAPFYFAEPLTKGS